MRQVKDCHGRLRRPRNDSVLLREERGIEEAASGAAAGFRLRLGIGAELVEVVAADQDLASNRGAHELAEAVLSQDPVQVRPADSEISRRLIERKEVPLVVFHNQLSAGEHNLCTRLAAVNALQSHFRPRNL